MFRLNFQRLIRGFKMPEGFLLLNINKSYILIVPMKQNNSSFLKKRCEWTLSSLPTPFFYFSTFGASVIAVGFSVRNTPLAIRFVTCARTAFSAVTR